jgi:hypothetical protein
MLTEEEFREELHGRLGERLDGVRARASLVDQLRARQARRTALLRGSSAMASVAVVAGIVAGADLWPHGSQLPPPPGPAASAARTSTVSPSVVPSPSTPVVNMSGVAPLVTSGPCKGLAVAVYQWSADLHPPVTALAPAGLVVTIGGGGGLRLKAAGPCVDRLSYVQRTGTFQNLVNEPLSFHDGSAGIDAQSSPQNQTGLVQFFVDCKGLVCSGSGAPLATLTIHVRGTSPGAASVPFAVLPSPLPLPPGEVVTIPSVVGMTPDQAREALQRAGVNEVAVSSDGSFDTGTVTLQDPPAGSVVIRGGGESLGVTGGQPFTRPPGRTAPPGVAPPSLFDPNANGDVPFIHWPQRGDLVNTITPLDAEVAWDATKGPHSDTRIVYAGAIDGMEGVILEGNLRMALLVRAMPDAPFTVLDDRFVRQNGGLRELSALGRPLLKGGKPAPYKIVFAVVHPGDVVSVKSPGLQEPGTQSYAILARVPLAATRGDTSLVITGGSRTLSVPLDPSSG